MIKQAFLHKPVARGLQFGKTNPAFQKIGNLPETADVFESPMGLQLGEFYSAEAERDLNEVERTVDMSLSNRGLSSFLGTVTANLVGGVSGLTVVRELAHFNEKNLLEIDFAKKPSAKSIKEKIVDADWVVINNFDKAGKSHESEIMAWQIGDDVRGSDDARFGDENRLVMSADENSVVAHGWARNSESRWRSYVSGRQELHKNYTFFPGRVKGKGFGLKAQDWRSFNESGLGYSDWVDQRKSEMTGKDWAYTRQLDGQKDVAPN